MKLLEKHSLLLLVQFAITSSMSPSCRHRNKEGELSYNCTGFTSADDFDRVFERPQVHSNLTLYLGHGHVSHLPSGTFRGLHLKKLILDNFTVDNFAISSQPSPFTDVKGTLDRIYFMRGSSTPSSWSVLKDLEVLNTLRFEEMENVSITSGMSEIPQSISFLEFFRSSISRVDDGALYRLNNLILFAINNCQLPNFRWSVLANPSPKLVFINLGSNNLTTIPRGFVPEQFPSLRYLSLHANRITSLDDAALDPFRRLNKTSISLVDNPIHCDCRMVSLPEYDLRNLYGKCETPEALKGREMQSVRATELDCNSAAS